MKPKWTIPRVKRELKSLVRSPGWTLHIAEMPPNGFSACCKWRFGKRHPFPLDILVDHDQAGRVPLVLHEMLHFVMRDALHGLYDAILEEAIVNALEKELMEGWITPTPSVFNWFRKRINERLEGCEGT